MKRFLLFSVTVAAVLFAVQPALAQEAATHAAEAAPAAIPYGAIAGALAMGFAAAFGAIGQGKAVMAACEGTARNPGATGSIRTTLLIGLAFIESLVLYVLVIVFVIK
ncbi:MAG: ATP synthase F0 subunit C [Acidobacteria bacterium]|nr:ATP synthase F0 subunit C [Acidobacteriota bacterium]